MTRISVLIGLREPLLRARVRELIREQPDFEVTAECGDGREALEELRRSRPELAVLDPALPRVDGFAILRQLDPETAPAVIFVAAGGEQALHAFEVGGLDYLLKPIERRRFGRALQRVRAQVRLQRSVAVGERLSALLQTLRSAADYPSRVPVASEGRVLFLSVDEIDAIEGSGNYVQIRAGNRVFKLRQTLASLESSLDPGRFRRIHRSTIVNLSCVREVEPLAGGSAAVRLRDGTVLKMSRGYRDLLSWLGTDSPGRVARLTGVDESEPGDSPSLPLPEIAEEEEHA